LLALLLVLPMVTAAIPGRGGVEFGERIAWMNSARVLAIPLPWGLHVSHLVLLVALMTMLVSVWQEVWPSLRRPYRGGSPAPESLLSLVRSMPGWEQCDAYVLPTDAIVLATGGRPGRPRVLVSRGAVESLTAPELEVVLRHEHAHWQAGRWLRAHGLFAVRMLQCYNPVALWAFREYCSELEIGCDAAAVQGTDPRVLGRILLRLYEAADRRDVAARGALRKRVNVLLAGGPQDDALPRYTVAAATVVLLITLPWIV
jgi:Zn-dependent protease with chaperone function